MRSSTQKVINEDSLERAKTAVRAVRDLQAQISSAEEALSAMKRELYKKIREELPDLFFEVGIDKVGIPAEGNMPAYDATLKPFAKAVIAAGWDEERKAQAFEYLEANGASSLIKNKIEIQLDRGDFELATKLRGVLESMNVDYESEMSVQWNTLTSWLKERIRQHKTPPLDIIGGDVGQIVELKERR
jgi:hypothetical protein